MTPAPDRIPEVVPIDKYLYIVLRQRQLKIDQS